MKKKKTLNHELMRYKNISCEKMSEQEIKETSDLFSKHYGTWSENAPEKNLRGKNINFSTKMIQQHFVKKEDRYVVMAYYDSKLIGHVFYLKRKGDKTKDIIWILQLVVAKDYRGYGIGSKLMHSIWGMSNCYAWGLFTSNPFTINALEKATMRKIDVSQIDKKFEKLKNVAYDIPLDTNWIESYNDGMVDTEFYADHSNLKEKIKTAYKKRRFPLNPGLLEGFEWLAFTFESQSPKVYETELLDEYLDYSEDILQQAYSNMEIEKHPWSSHTKEEVNYLCEEFISDDYLVLDVGCGIGRHTMELNNRGIKTIGIDFSKRHIEYAKKQSNPDSFICGDVIKYKFKEKFDVALALYDVIGSFENEKKNLKVLKSIRKNLNKNGILILSVMNMEYTRKVCKSKNNIIDNINIDIDKLLRLPATKTMQKTGNVFLGQSTLIDNSTGIVYRKEQFENEDSLPCEYVMRDRRYTKNGIKKLLKKAGFSVQECYTFSAKDMSKEIDSNRAKEIFVVAEKSGIISSLFRYPFIIPKAWK